MSKGTVVVVEGFDGSGKSSIVSNLAKLLEEQGQEVVIVRQPGGTPFAEQLRNIFMHGLDPISERAQTYLMLAARQDLHDRVVAPALADGKIVLCDRHYFSGLVFQPSCEKIILENKIFEADFLLTTDCEFMECLRRQRARGDDDNMALKSDIVKRQQYHRYHKVHNKADVPYKLTINTDRPQEKTAVQLHSVAKLVIDIHSDK